MSPEEISAISDAVAQAAKEAATSALFKVLGNPLPDGVVRRLGMQVELDTQSAAVRAVTATLRHREG